jgi:hypothetical protein
LKVTAPSGSIDRLSSAVHVLVLQWCYTCVLCLCLCYSGVTHVFYTDVTLVLHWCYLAGTVVLQCVGGGTFFVERIKEQIYTSNSADNGERVATPW